MNINTIDLNLLRIFEALLQEQGVGKAARRVGLSQPALSNALRRLRIALDDPLFVRAGQSMVPTARARQMRRPVLDALATIRHALGGHPPFEASLATATFRLLTDDLGESLIIGPLVAAVRQLAPQVTLQIRRAVGLFDLPENDLVAGTIDLALGLFPTPSPGSGLLHAPVHADDLIAIADRRSIRAARLSKREFLARPHVRVNVREGPGLLDDLLAVRGLARRVAVSCPSLLTVPRVVEGTDLLGIVPRAVALRAPNVARLRQMTLPLRTPRLRWSFVWHERTQDDAAHAWFRSVCVRAFAASYHVTNSAAARRMVHLRG